MEIIGSGTGAGLAGTDYDQLVVTTAGGLGYGGTLNLAFGNAGAFANGTAFDLFSFSGNSSRHFASMVSSGSGLYSGLSFTGANGVWTSTAGGQNLTFSESTGRLTFSAAAASVPEPSSLILSGLGVFGMLWIRGRRGARGG
jgi:hypothetical protein